MKPYGDLLKYNLAWYVFKLGNTWLIFDMLIFINFRRIQKNAIELN